MLKGSCDKVSTILSTNVWIVTNVCNIDLATSGSATWSTSAEALVESPLHPTAKAAATTRTTRTTSGGTASGSSNKPGFGFAVLYFALAR